MRTQQKYKNMPVSGAVVVVTQDGYFYPLSAQDTLYPHDEQIIAEFKTYRGASNFASKMWEEVLGSGVSV